MRPQPRRSRNDVGFQRVTVVKTLGRELVLALMTHSRPRKGLFWGRGSVPRPNVSKTPYKHRLHTKEPRAERGLLSNLFRQPRKIISAVK
jgi:hypothetical protein